MKDDNVTSCLGMILGFLVAPVVVSIANGWALSTVWNWFIPPIFHLSELTIPQAIGVGMVLNLFTGTKSTKSEDTKNKSFGEVLVETLIVSSLTAVLTVGFAWIILRFAF